MLVAKNLRLVIWLGFNFACSCGSKRLELSNENLITDIRWAIREAELEAYNQYGYNYINHSRYEASEEVRVKGLYDQIVQQPHGVQLFFGDLQIRRLARLQHGQKCNPEKEKELNLVSGLLSGTARNCTINPGMNFSIDVLKWQSKVLGSHEPLCNYRLHLVCNHESRACECAVGQTVQVIKEARVYPRCDLPEGHDCDNEEPGGKALTYYDSLMNLSGWTCGKMPPCGEGMSCMERQFFFRKKCWCSNKGKTCPSKNGKVMGVHGAEYMLERSDVISSNMMLGFGEECVENLQKDLLFPSGTEVVRTQDRLETLRTLVDHDIGFCRLDMFLNCSQSRGRCECWDNFEKEDPLVEQSRCKIRNGFPCGHSLLDGISFYPGGQSIRRTGKMLQIRTEPPCITGARCVARGEMDTTVFTCTCVDNAFTGYGCSEGRATLFALIDSATVWKFPPDATHNQVLFQFNNLLYALEQRMKLNHDSSCHTKNFQYFALFFKFLIRTSRNIEIGTRSRTEFKDFQKALDWAKQMEADTFELCDARQGLTCLPIEHRCRCMNGMHWNQKYKRCFLDAEEICDFSNRTKYLWKFDCPERSVCSVIQSLDEGIEKRCVCLPGFQGVKCISSRQQEMRQDGQKKIPDSRKQELFSFIHPKRKISPEHGVLDYIKHAGDEQIESSDIHSKEVNNKTEDKEISGKYGSSVGKADPVFHSVDDLNRYFFLPPVKVFPGVYSDLLNETRETLKRKMILQIGDKCNPNVDDALRLRKFFTLEDSIESDIEKIQFLQELQNDLECEGNDRLCNAFNYFFCDPKRKRCDCNVAYRLIAEADGRCHLPRMHFCAKGGKISRGLKLDGTRPIPTCAKGHVCDMTLRNVYRCRPLYPGEVLGRSDVSRVSSSRAPTSALKLMTVISSVFLIPPVLV